MISFPQMDICLSSNNTIIYRYRGLERVSHVVFVMTHLCLPPVSYLVVRNEGLTSLEKFSSLLSLAGSLSSPTVPPPSSPRLLRSCREAIEKITTILGPSSLPAVTQPPSQSFLKVSFNTSILSRTRMLGAGSCGPTFCSSTKPLNPPQLEETRCPCSENTALGWGRSFSSIWKSCPPSLKLQTHQRESVLFHRSYLGSVLNTGLQASP